MANKVKATSTYVTGIPNPFAPAGTTPTTTTTPNSYMDAYNVSADQIRRGYEQQAQAAEQRKNEYMQTLESNDAAWRQGQSELRDAYLQNMATRQDRQTTQSNANYDNTARQNYINYRQAEKRLPTQLRSLGMRGGASESSLIRLGTNFNTNVSNNEMARAQALDSIAQQYADAIQEYEMQYKQALLSRDDSKANQIASYLDSWNQELANIEASKNEALNSAYVTALQNDIQRRDEKNKIAYERSRDKISDKRYEKEYKDAQKSKKLEQYAAGLARYTSVSTLKNMIKAIQKDKNWAKDPFKYGKVQAINARIGEIRAK